MWGSSCPAVQPSLEQQPSTAVTSAQSLGPPSKPLRIAIGELGGHAGCDFDFETLPSELDGADFKPVTRTEIGQGGQVPLADHDLLTSEGGPRLADKAIH